MSQTDNTQFLEAIHAVIVSGEEIVAVLNEAAKEAEAPEARMLATVVGTVINTHADIIRKLVESQLELTDKIDEIVTKYNV